MTYYTVQCGFRTYKSNTVTVEADSPDAALTLAIETADADPHWESVDFCDPTFIEAFAEGEDIDLWSDGVMQLPVPPEKGEEQGVSKAGRDALADALIKAAAAIRDIEPGCSANDLDTPLSVLKTIILAALNSANVSVDEADLFPPNP